MKSRVVFPTLGLIALALLMACGVSSLGSPTPAPAPPVGTRESVPAGALVISNGTVIDGTGAAPIHDGIVVIVGDKIAAVGPATRYAIPPGARVLDAQGGTILPGIINSHVHETGSGLVRQFYFLNQGVTSACNLASPIDEMARHGFDEGYGLTARNFRSGPIINAPGGYPATDFMLYPVNNPAEARAAALDLVARDADMFKLAVESYSNKYPWPVPPAPTPAPSIPNLDLDEIRAVVEVAHAHDKLVRVHLGTAEQLDVVLDGGVDVIEHIPLPGPADIDFGAVAADGNFARLSPAYEAKLARMVQQKVWMVPTMDKIITWCESGAQTPDQTSRCEKYVTASVHRFRELGGVIALGDDSGYKMRTGMPIPEMKRLLAAGLSPMEIIQAGTQRAARVCGHGNELGTLEPGKLADVIAVSGNPLDNIEALSGVNLVILGGKVAIPHQ